MEEPKDHSQRSSWNDVFPCVLVANVPLSVSEEYIWSICLLEDIKVVSKRFIPDPHGVMCNSAFITYENPEIAVRAHGTLTWLLNSTSFRVCYVPDFLYYSEARIATCRRSCYVKGRECQVFIKNLHQLVLEAELRTLLSPYGRVKDISIEVVNPRNSCVVTFSNCIEALQAELGLNLTRFRGFLIDVRTGYNIDCFQSLLKVPDLSAEQPDSSNGKENVAPSVEEVGKQNSD